MALITLRQLLDHAAEHGYGVPAFNINNMEQGLAIMEAAKATDAPVIIQAIARRAPMPATSCWPR
jgi:fructose-bisphosphate aldolase, class II